MQASQAASAVLEQAQGAARADVPALGALCERLHAAVAACSTCNDSCSASTAADIVAQSLAAAHKRLRGAAPDAQAQLLAVLSHAVQQCPFGKQLTDGISAMTPDLLAVVKHGPPACVEAACACFCAIAARMSQHLASAAAKSAAAQALAAATTAAVHLVQSGQSPAHRHHGLLLVCSIADTHPQLLKSQAATICTACCNEIAPNLADGAEHAHHAAQAALPMETRLHAAHALARMACASGTPEGWGAHMQGLLIATHHALAALPMPATDGDVLRAAQDVLGTPEAAVWAQFSAPGQHSSLSERVEVVTLLLHSLAVMLTSKSATLAPLPMSALVLLVSRLLSLREQPGVAEQGDLEACQWHACAPALLTAGACLTALSTNMPADAFCCASGICMRQSLVLHMWHMRAVSSQCTLLACCLRTAHNPVAFWAFE